MKKQKELWEDVKKTYNWLTDDEDIADEVLAHYSGKKGKERLDAMMEKVDKGDAAGYAQVIATIDGVKRVLNNFWRKVANMLGMRWTSAERVADAVMGDLMKEERMEGREEDGISELGDNKITTHSEELAAGMRGGTLGELARFSLSKDSKKKSLKEDSQDLTTLIVSSKSDGAKVRIKIETAKENLNNLSKTYKGERRTRGFLNDLNAALGNNERGVESHYFDFATKQGQRVTIRTSNHNVNGENVNENTHLVSVVVKSRRSPNSFILGEGEVKEYVYFKERIKGSDKDVLSGIADSIKSLLETGEFKDLTGIAVENPPAEPASKSFSDVQGNEGKISGNDDAVEEQKGQPMFQMKGKEGAATAEPSLTEKPASEGVMMREGERREERREVSRKDWEEMAYLREWLDREIKDVNKRIVGMQWGSEEWNRLFDERAKLMGERKAVEQELARFQRGEDVNNEEKLKMLQ